MRNATKVQKSVTKKEKVRNFKETNNHNKITDETYTEQYVQDRMGSSVIVSTAEAMGRPRLKSSSQESQGNH